MSLQKLSSSDERTRNSIKENSRAVLKQGTSGATVQTSHGTSHWERQRTRILSSAEKVNLHFKTALPRLEAGLSHALSGFF